MTRQHYLESDLADPYNDAGYEIYLALAKDPRLLAEFQEGVKVYETAFAAFMLVPGVAKLPANTLIDVFVDSFRIEGTDYRDAVARLTDHLARMEKADRDPNTEVTSPPRRVDQKLLEAYERQYEFVPIKVSCFVFDRAEIPTFKS